MSSEENAAHPKVTRNALFWLYITDGGELPALKESLGTLLTQAGTVPSGSGQQVTMHT